MRAKTRRRAPEIDEILSNPKLLDEWTERVGERMEENRQELLKILEGVGDTLIRRTVVAFRRWPENFAEEAGTLELVIDLKKKLAG